MLADRYQLTRAGLRARNNLGVWLNNDDPAGGLAMAAESLEIARRLGLRDEVLWFTTQQCFRLVWRGETAEAKAISEELFAEETLPSLHRLFMTIRDAHIAALEGDMARVQQRLTEADEVRGDYSNPEYRAGDTATRAAIVRLQGDPHAAVRLLEESLEVVPLSVYDLPSRARPLLRPAGSDRRRETRP